MSNIIIESGMNFIADNAFRIEKSPLYTQLGSNVKSVEFIRAINDKLLFIEAKSSFPNPNNPAPNPNRGNKTGGELFREEIVEICDKFIHSLNLYSAVAIGVTDDTFPPDYNPPNKVSLLFILVINGFKMTWCDEIERALTNLIRKSIYVANIWKPEVSVINDKIASSRGLITKR